MKLTKTLMTLGLASAMMMPFSACQKTQRENPLLQESTLPFGAPDFTKIREPKIAENHYIMTQADLDEYERVKREEPQTLWRASEMKLISDKPVLKSADRAGYYITIK